MLSTPSSPPRLHQVFDVLVVEDEALHPLHIHSRHQERHRGTQPRHGDRHPPCGGNPVGAEDLVRFVCCVFAVRLYDEFVLWDLEDELHLRVGALHDEFDGACLRQHGGHGAQVLPVPHVGDECFAPLPLLLRRGVVCRVALRVAVKRGCTRHTPPALLRRMEVMECTRRLRREARMDGVERGGQGTLWHCVTVRTTLRFTTSEHVYSEHRSVHCCLEIQPGRNPIRGCSCE